MSVRRVVIFGGTAVVAMLWSTSAGALATPPTTAGVPLPTRPAVRVAPVDDVVATVPALDPATPTKSLPSASLPGAPRPARPTSQQRVHTSSRATPAAAPHTRSGVAATGGSPASIEHERAIGAPAVDSAVVDARPVGVNGTLDTPSNARPWSPLGTAATGLASWGALCALALLARWIVISAWRDAPRRRRAFSLR
jgi:hypothetical protein